MSIAYDNMNIDNLQRTLEQHHFVSSVTHWRKPKNRQTYGKILRGREKIYNLLNRATTL